MVAKHYSIYRRWRTKNSLLEIYIYLSWFIVLVDSMKIVPFLGRFMQNGSQCRGVLRFYRDSKGEYVSGLSIQPWLVLVDVLWRLNPLRSKCTKLPGYRLPHWAYKGNKESDERSITKTIGLVQRLNQTTKWNEDAKGFMDGMREEHLWRWVYVFTPKEMSELPLGFRATWFCIPISILKLETKL